MGKYDDMLNMPHHVSSTRPHMSMHDRAAQFSPFAALVGYDDAVKETARLTNEKLELTADKITDLNHKIAFLTENADKRPEVTIEYFIPDEKRREVSTLHFRGLSDVLTSITIIWFL